jgi:hypothetical protein
VEPEQRGEPPAGESADVEASAIDVGDFRQGMASSRWALSRYLVGRAIGESVSRSLLLASLGVLAVAALLEWGLGATFWAVVVAVVALIALAMRAVLRAVLRRLTAADQIQPVAGRIQEMVADTRADVLRELRRVGLPGRTWTLPLLALRFIGGNRRRDTVARLRTFELDRVVPAARIDEFHLLIRSGVGR